MAVIEGEVVFILTEKGNAGRFRSVLSNFRDMRSDLSKLLRGIRTVKGAKIRRLESNTRMYVASAPDRADLTINVQA